MLTLAADAMDAYGWARNGNPSQRGEAILQLRDLAGTGLPPSIWVRWWLGELYMEDGRPGDAVAYLESLRGTGVPHVGNLLLGRAYTELGEREKARDAYVRFLQAWERSRSRIFRSWRKPAPLSKSCSPAEGRPCRPGPHPGSTGFGLTPA